MDNLQQRIERKLELAKQEQEGTEAGAPWAYLHGYITACERILADIIERRVEAALWNETGVGPTGSVAPRIWDTVSGI